MGEPGRLRIATAVAASAILLFFGSGLHPLWPLTWLSVLPVLLVSRRCSAQCAFLAAGLAWSAGEANMWPYLSGLAPAPLVIVFTLVPAAVFGLGVLLFRAFVRRHAPWRGTLALPVAWVAYEHLNAVASPHGTFGSLAYTQADNLPVLQLASVTGIAGISFLLLLAPAALAATFTRRDAGGHGRRGSVLAVGAILAGVVAYGSWRLAQPSGASQVGVGLMASDLRENVDPVEAGDTPRLLRDYVSRAADLSSRGAQVIVLPEKLGVVRDPGLEGVDALLQGVTARDGTTIAAGLIRRSGGASFNEARVYAAGRRVGVYDKHHMLPPFESELTPGSARVVIPAAPAPWGVAICKDMDFPSPSRGYGLDGVGLLLVPAWDFGADGWLHARMAVARGVENGFTVVRAAKMGRLTVSDDRGRILGEARSGAAPFASLVTTAPVGRGRTPYAVLGNWFGWADLGFLAILLVSLAVSEGVPPARPR